MITQLIATLMISTGVAMSSTPVLSKETKPNLLNADTTTNFTYQPPQSAVSERNITFSTSYGVVSRQHTMMTRYEGYNEALNVHADCTVATTAPEETLDEVFFAYQPQTQWNNTSGYEAEYGQYTNTLIGMQITPYRYMTEANATLQFAITSTIDLEVSRLNEQGEVGWQYYTGKVYVQFDVFSSVDNNWQNYINTSTWNTACYNNNVIASLTSAENGYQFNHETYTYESETITMNGNNGQIHFNQIIDLNIVGDRNNYIFIYCTPYIPHVNGEETFTRKIKAYNNNVWMVPRGTTPLIFSGTMITPVSNYEVIDLPGLLFNILTMPFAFISTAFNLTLFPGTPYQINLASIFLAVIGVLVFIFILRLFMKNKLGG